ncbi:DGQHR domain-containing protein [Alteromonas sp. DY56-G5]|uniref:DGQHR domain-containing protein n=1 Tax=Alteromonas sp. DY56-G5 TaxID=2967128 RepID=UPI00352B3749
MKKIETSYLSVRQPIGDFYCCVMNASDLYDISFTDVRTMENESEDGVGTYLGIQRSLNKSRVKKIKEYVRSVDATFPNSIIIAVPEKFVSLGQRLLTIEYDEDKSGKIAKILDGQHRLAGFDGTNGKYTNREGDQENFELLVTIFVEADLHTQAQVFTMVNQSQTKVNKSLVYDLESLALARSPYRTAHQIAVLLNGKSDSPFHKRIKRLGVKTQGIEGELLTQAAFVENLIKLISKKASFDRDILLGRKKKFLGLKEKNLPDCQHSDFRRLVFRNSFIEEDDAAIAANVFNFFSAINQRWPLAWSRDNKDSVLNKTIGLIASFRLLRDIFNKLVDSGEANFGDVVAQSVYLKLLSDVDLDDEFFEKIDAVSKSSGFIYKKMNQYI